MLSFALTSYFEQLLTRSIPVCISQPEEFCSRVWSGTSIESIDVGSMVRP